MQRIKLLLPAIILLGGIVLVSAAQANTKEQTTAREPETQMCVDQASCHQDTDQSVTNNDLPAYSEPTPAPTIAPISTKVRSTPAPQVTTSAAQPVTTAPAPAPSMNPIEPAPISVAPKPNTSQKTTTVCMNGATGLPVSCP